LVIIVSPDVTEIIDKAHPEKGFIAPKLPSLCFSLMWNAKQKNDDVWNDSSGHPAGLVSAKVKN
jgi:hypothetical protein